MDTTYNVNIDLTPFYKAVKHVDRKFTVLAIAAAACVVRLRYKISKLNQKIDDLSKEIKEHTGPEGE